MVTFGDVARRHAFYAAAVLAVVAFAARPPLLTVALLCVLVPLARSLKTPPTFSLCSGAGGTAVMSACATLSTHTFWFANGLAGVEVPLWLPAASAVAAHWFLDVYYLCTLTELRMSTLP